MEFIKSDADILDAGDERRAAADLADDDWLGWPIATAAELAEREKEYSEEEIPELELVCECFQLDEDEFDESGCPLHDAGSPWFIPSDPSPSWPRTHISNQPAPEARVASNKPIGKLNTPATEAA